MAYPNRSSSRPTMLCNGRWHLDAILDPDGHDPLHARLAFEGERFRIIVHRLTHLLEEELVQTPGVWAISILAHPLTNVLGGVQAQVSVARRAAIHSKQFPEGPLARAAAPITPESRPRAASLTSTRSRPGERARTYISSRAHSSRGPPPPIAPPPTTTSSGLKTLTNPASPMPSQRPTSFSTESATSSPSRASLVTSSPSTSRSMASRPRAEFGLSLATSPARRPIAVPEAKASRQPRLPHAQRGPAA